MQQRAFGYHGRYARRVTQAKLKRLVVYDFQDVPLIKAKQRGIGLPRVSRGLTVSRNWYQVKRAFCRCDFYFYSGPLACTRPRSCHLWIASSYVIRLCPFGLHPWHPVLDAPADAPSGRVIPHDLFVSGIHVYRAWAIWCTASSIPSVVWASKHNTMLLTKPRGARVPYVVYIRRLHS